MILLQECEINYINVNEVIIAFLWNMFGGKIET